ncbi:carbamoyltransferase C-terminal domain-containing protein [Paracoccus isoporae]|uniref:carbamoyltransferase C-terminal domain-containing protein n=1 Tax=Paracoccus isoporae TaxID=591205 RepID=UPI0015A2B7DA|nr:carbamoyltransferase C-terminal domain-containing protein [Paracoccus isoporae]
MKILSFKSGTGGALAAIDAARRELLFSYEAEKDSFPKNTSATADTFIAGAEWFGDLPDVLAQSGTAKTGLEYATAAGAGYFGVSSDAVTIRKKGFFGRTLDYFSSSHERAHIWTAYGLSPFPQGQPCYVLVWDDVLGDFYEVDESLSIRHLGRVMDRPCSRLTAAHALAVSDGQAGNPMRKGGFGRILAAASCGNAGAVDAKGRRLIAQLISADDASVPIETCYRGIGAQDPRFRDMAAGLSDEIFAAFAGFARANLTAGHPLLIAGEGGLHAGWTARWQDTGLFPDVFVPPPAGDVGCAIGTAIDAMRHFTGQAKIGWSVYAGQPFHDDAAANAGLKGSEIDPDQIAAALAAGDVIGWAAGNCEIGPRALGNRSIFAAPFDAAMRRRLNAMKDRPADSPISPVCLEEDAALHFAGHLPSPHMLYRQHVTDGRLAAVSHADGTARVQTVSKNQHPMLHALLLAFKKRSGVGVLCNTSLNFAGAGFINKTSDLHHFATAARLDGFVAGIRYYRI